MVCECLNHPEPRKRHRDYSAATCENGGCFKRPKFFFDDEIR